MDIADARLDAENIQHELGKMARMVGALVAEAFEAFKGGDKALAQGVIEKDDRIDALNVLIVDRCFDLIEQGKLPKPEVLSLRGYVRVSTNLEKLADYGVNIAKQTLHIKDNSPIPPWVPIDELADIIDAGLKMALDALFQKDIELAQDVCAFEVRLDEIYQRGVAALFDEASRVGLSEENFPITYLFALKYAENMGDVLANLGELGVYTILGEKIKVHQLLHIRETLENHSVAGMQALWGGKSGARVFLVEQDGHRRLVLKEGERSKISEEAQKIEDWQRVYPGVVPKLTVEQYFGDREILVTEYLQGKTFEEILFFGDFELKRRSLERIIEVLRMLWQSTIRKAEPSTRYVPQLIKRLKEVHAFYPELEEIRKFPVSFCGKSAPSLIELLQRAALLEEEVLPPFEVWIHGDFNSNNVFYDSRTDGVKFIDVHRSGYGDYIQDIATIIVSNIRNPLLSTYLKEDLVFVNESLERFAEAFGRAYSDRHAKRRLMVALGRMFITSSRVVNQLELAKKLYLLGILHLERFIAWPQSE